MERGVFCSVLCSIFKGPRQQECCCSAEKPGGPVSRDHGSVLRLDATCELLSDMQNGPVLSFALHDAGKSSVETTNQ
jgi:hypothetical protein